MRELAIPNVARTPAPSCVLNGFEHGNLRYQLRYFLTDFLEDDTTDSMVRVHLFASLQRAGIRIAEPQQHRPRGAARRGARRDGAEARAHPAAAGARTRCRSSPRCPRTRRPTSPSGCSTRRSRAATSSPSRATRRTGCTSSPSARPRCCTSRRAARRSVIGTVRAGPVLRRDGADHRRRAQPPPWWPRPTSSATASTAPRSRSCCARGPRSPRKSQRVMGGRAGPTSSSARDAFARVPVSRWPRRGSPRSRGSGASSCGQLALNFRRRGTAPRESAITPGAALHHRVAQRRRLHQHVVGVEARGRDLRLVEGFVSSTSFFSAASAARAICQPPATIPSSLRNGTAPAKAARGSLPRATMNSTHVGDRLHARGERLRRPACRDSPSARARRRASSAPRATPSRWRRLRARSCGRRGPSPGCRWCLRRSW